MAAPVVQALRAHYRDEAQIDFITLNKFKGATELILGINTIYTVEKSTVEVTPQLKENGYDYLIDLHSNVRSRSLARSLNIMTFKINKLGAARLSLVLGMRKRPVEHFIDRSLKLLSPFSVSESTDNPWGEIACSKPKMELPEKYLALVPGAAHIGKRLPDYSIDAICSSSDIPIVIVGGPDDTDLAQRFTDRYPSKVISAAGTCSLKETAHIMRHALVAIGGDTGAMHIATAVGAPLVSVWGCTRPSLGLHPWRPNPKSIILQPEGRGNRPCSRHGARCRYKKHGKNLCINDVTPERITSAISSLLK